MAAIITNTPNIIVYKGDNLFTIKRAESTESLAIDFDIYDQKGSKVAVVKQGRIYSGDKDSYERTVSKDEYLLKDKKTGRIICHIRKRSMTSHAELEVNVSLYTKDGFLISATPEKTNIGSSAITGTTFENCGAAILIA